MYKIIYDMDDVLWPLANRVFQQNNTPLAHTDFHLYDSPNLSTEDCDRAIAGFKNPETFAHIEFYAGARDILRPRELGAKVQINSNSYNAEIRAHKLRQLLEFFPELTEDDLQLNLIQKDKSGHLRKTGVGNDVLIFIDDSPYNVASSAARINIMPRKTWNINARAREVASGDKKDVRFVEDWRSVLPEIATRRRKQIVYADGLAEVNELVYHIIKYLKEQESQHAS